MVPLATRRQREPALSMQPKPSFWLPGSSPRTFIAWVRTYGRPRRDRRGRSHPPVSAVQLLEDLARDVEVGPDLLHVVVVFQHLHDAQDLLRLLLGPDRRGRLRNARQ